MKFEYPSIVGGANRLLNRKSTSPINADELMEGAIKSTGLSDFGDTFFVEPLQRLIADANRYTTFHPVGHYLLRQKLKYNLENRLWAQYWIEREPSIIETPLPPIVLINGLQRTGTTFLQRLLGSLPEMRGIHSWETVTPVPRHKRKKNYGRYKAHFAHAAFNWINPEFKTIHAVDPDSLEEEVILMDHSFVSTATLAVLNLPDYAEWLESTSQKRHYEDLKMWLQFLCWRQPAQPYLLLKSPHHMEHIEEFVEVFPDTKIIHTHRDPVETLPSYCSMVRSGQKLFMPESDTYEIGDYWLYKNKRFVDRCLSYRDKVDNHNFHDISYKEFVANPIGMVERLYAHLNLDWTEHHKATAKAFHATHRKNKHGKHLYKMEDYDLSEEIIHDKFQKYIVDYAEYL